VKALSCALFLAGSMAVPGAQTAGNSETVTGRDIQYRVLATSKTSTMEKELNEGAEAGFRFEAAMGGETAFGGHEVVIVMSKGGEEKGRYAYKLLATSKTSTMRKELKQAAEAAFNYKGQTLFNTEFGGNEVVVILERSNDAPEVFDYELFATSKTSTLQKELLAAGSRGYAIVGMTVGKTALGGDEIVAVTRRRKLQ
jgi:hypothetical protein